MVPSYLPMWAAPVSSASPPLPRSYSSSDRSTEAPLRAGTGTARARRRPASGPAPPVVRPGRARARRQPASSRGPRGGRSRSPLPSPWTLGGTGGSRCAWAGRRKRMLWMKQRSGVLSVGKSFFFFPHSFPFKKSEAGVRELILHANLLGASLLFCRATEPPYSHQI